MFLGRKASKELFRGIFSRRKNRPTGAAWSFNHSGLFLDFLAGNQSYQCTPWSNPTYNVFGWQRPCYLLSDEGYADSYKSLIEDTAWEQYGVGKNPRCDNCMAHCGFEGTAVNDAFSHPLKAFVASLRGLASKARWLPSCRFNTPSRRAHVIRPPMPPSPPSPFHRSSASGASPKTTRSNRADRTLADGECACKTQLIE